MDIHQDHQGRVLVVAPVGRLDSTTSEALEQALTTALDQRECQLVVDFEGVTYISSVGLRVLLTVAKRIREGHGSLVLCALGDAVRQVFELAGFLPLFSIERARDLAITRCAPGA